MHGLKLCKTGDYTQPIANGLGIGSVHVQERSRRKKSAKKIKLLLDRFRVRKAHYERVPFMTKDNRSDWVRLPWKPGEEQPRLSDGYVGLRATKDGGIEGLPRLEQETTETEWLTIDTAPRDGSRFLAVRLDEHSCFGPVILCGFPTWKWNVWQSESGAVFWDATHWMPLPKPPRRSND